MILESSPETAIGTSSAATAARMGDSIVCERQQNYNAAIKSTRSNAGTLGGLTTNKSVQCTLAREVHTPEWTQMAPA